MKILRIVVAEDNPVERSFIEKGLAKTGLFQIIKMAFNGAALIDFLEHMPVEEHPDLILSDINMPLKTGLEALTEARDLPSLRDIPFFVFSTCSLASTKDKCMDLGADHFLTKPASFLDYEDFGRLLHRKFIYLQSKLK